jgi:uncharacterized protein (TIGR02001 family)
MNLKGLMIGAAAAVALATGARAADTETTQEEIASKFDVAFGAAVTTQYVSRGVQQSDGFAVQGYVEPSYGWFYAGVWASNIGPVISAPDTVEIDLYAGIRPTFGNLSLDFGYAHYLFNVTGTVGGEIYGKASYAFTENFSAGVELYQDVINNATYGTVTTEVALPYDFTLSGGLGSNFTTGNVDWNAGVSCTFADTVTLDLRYYGTNGIDDPAFGDRIVATLSLDTAISKLRGH